jgi:hypothetical protein
MPSVNDFYASEKGAMWTRVNYPSYDFEKCEYAKKGSYEGTAMGELLKVKNYKDTTAAQGPEDIHQDACNLMIRTGMLHRMMDKKSGKPNELKQAREQMRKNLLDDRGGAVGTLSASMAIEYGITNPTEPSEWGECDDPDSECVNATGLIEWNKIMGSDDSAKTVFLTNIERIVTPVLDNLKEGIVTSIAMGANEAKAKDDARRNAKAWEKQYVDAMVKALDATYTTIRDVEAITEYAHIGDSEELKALFKTIYSTWHDEGPDPAMARKFYTATLGVYAHSGSTAFRKPVPRSPAIDPTQNEFRDQKGLLGGYTRLTVDEIMDVVENHMTDDYLKTMRFNLLKTQGGDGAETVFESCIPNTSTRYWLRQVDGTTLKMFEEEITLRVLYDMGYAMDDRMMPLMLGGMLDMKYDEKEFNLDFYKFLKNVEKDFEADCDKEPPTEPCDDEFISTYGDSAMKYADFARDELWEWDCDESKFYRTGKNGNKYYEESGIDESNCYGTYLRGDPKTCASVFQCLLMGDSTTLNQCIKLLTNESLFDIAIGDIKKLTPTIIRKFLRKFGIRGTEEYDNNGQKYLITMSYDEWKTEVLDKSGGGHFDKETVAALKNEKITTYLKGIFTEARANPAIVNKFIPVTKGTSYGSPASDFVREVGIKQYKDPRKQSNDYAVTAAMLRSLPRNTFNAYYSPFMGSLHGTTFRSAQQSPVLSYGGASVQTGGHGTIGVGTNFLLTRGTRLDGRNLSLKDGSGTMFDELYNAVNKGLSDMGLVINPDDKKRIVSAISNLKKIENTFIQVIKKLSVAVRTAEALGVHNYVVDRQNVMELPELSKLNSVADAQQAMKGHVIKLREAYEALNGHYGQVASDFTSHVMPRYLDRCCEPCDKPKTAPSAKWVDLETCEDC